MKNAKIYSKDWLLLHPYKQAGETDNYYTHIANQIYDILDAKSFFNAFEKEARTQICIRIAAYFEDVISGLNIWRSFINEYKRQTGNYLPFYTLGDNYYDDEVNLEDIRFLLWHFTQQFLGMRRGTFVHPDNESYETSSQEIFQLFCDEWEVAPENPKMQALFAHETLYNTHEEYQSLLYWFHYYSYLFVDTQARLNETIKAFWQQDPENQKDTQTILNMHNSLAYIDRSCFLAYSSPKWLSLILPENHPSHDFFVKQAELSESFINPAIEAHLESNKTNHARFVEVMGEQRLVYMNNKEEFVTFATQQLQLEESAYKPLADCITFNKFALYASPKEGLQLIVDGIDLIKDEANPFYNEKEAIEQALAFFIFKHCSMDMLRYLEEHNLLADAQTKYPNNPERGKAIIHENWTFLVNYFIRELV